MLTSMPYLIGIDPAILNCERNGNAFLLWSQYSRLFGFQLSSQEFDSIRSIMPPPKSMIRRGSRMLKLYSKPLYLSVRSGALVSTRLVPICAALAVLML